MAFGEHVSSGGYGDIGDYDVTVAERKAFQSAGVSNADSNPIPEDTRAVKSRELAAGMTDREFIAHLANAALVGTYPDASESRRFDHVAGARTAIEWILNLNGERYPKIGDAAFREVRSDILVEEFSKRLGVVVEKPNA